MSSERRYMWVATTLVFVVVVVLFALPKVREELAPDPVAALVAVAVDGDTVARTGEVAFEAGRPFLLHAVLVAEDRAGEPVYYTEASELEIDGRRVPAERLRRWRDDERTVVLWFTVEGFRPFTEVSSVADLDAFRWEETFRPDWGRGWSVDGTVAPRNPNFARRPEGRAAPEFGSARFHVRIERYFRPGDPAPIGRYRSPGAAETLVAPRSVTRVVARLPGPLRAPSEAFGLAHFEPVPGASADLLRRIRRLDGDGLGFARLLLLDRIVAARGLAWGALEWSNVEIAESPPWGAVGAGDLLRSGERVVVLYEDSGEPGVLDYEDLCFDYAENAAIRSLGEVFRSGGVLDWVDLEPQWAEEED